MTDKGLECLEELGVSEPAGAPSAGAEVLQQRLLAHVAHGGDLRPPQAGPTPPDTRGRRVAQRWVDVHSSITQSPG